ncbi:MAG: hypothetical protein HKN28_06545 [Alphaproteobacteria bacterium]|nr:hypothetical protein [Alphaproteobacteria bacterium]
MSDELRPQIVVYALPDACAALQAAAAHDLHITLVSPAGAAAFAGPGWFRALVAQASAAVPQADFDAILDCAGSAGLAMAAMREGVAAICFDGPADVRAKIEDMAAQSGCVVAMIDYDQALDLDRCEDAAAACGDWLEQYQTGKIAENTV